MSATKRLPSVLAVIALLAAACQSTTPTPAPPATGGQATPAPASTGPASTTEPGQPSQGVGGFPIDVAFGDLVELPTTSQWGTRVFASADGTNVVIPGRRVDAPGALSQPRLAFRNRDGSWTDTEFKVDKGIDQPDGYPKNLTGLRINGVAFASAGMVAIGTTLYYSATDDPTYRSDAWFSTDGATWQRTNLAEASGTEELQLQAVAAVDDGFIAVGAASNATSTDAAKIVVLGSGDGRHWTRLLGFAGRWAVGASAVLQLRDRLVVVGAEYACNDAGPAFGKETTGAQLRLWSSTDHGATWSQTFLDAAGLVAANALPDDLAGCPDPKAPDYRTQLARMFATPGRYLGVAGGRLVVAFDDEQRVISSTDLQTWTSGVLPFGAPEGGRPYGADFLVRTVMDDGEGLAVISVEAPRTSAGAAISAVQQQPIVWRSGDGATWLRVDAKPQQVEVDGTSASLTAEPWGEILLVTFQPTPYDTTGESGWTHVRTAGGH